MPAKAGIQYAKVSRRTPGRRLLDCPVKPGNDEKRSTTRVTKTRAAHAPKSNDAEILRRIAGMLSLWRICGNATCRRAQAYRGRPHRCGKRNVAALPSRGARLLEGASRREILPHAVREISGGNGGKPRSRGPFRLGGCGEWAPFFFASAKYA
jgi:hypothetical protein